MSSTRKSTLLALAVLLPGCGSIGGVVPDTSHEIAITSVPPGVSVIADGADLGTTPARIDPSDAFRAGFTGGHDGLLSYRYIGKLVLKRPGCKDHVVDVDDNVLSQDIHVEMECDPDYREPAPADRKVSRPSALTETAEQRLQRIETLHNKGLISDTEYRDLRQRVLETL